MLIYFSADSKSSVSLLIRVFVPFLLFLGLATGAACLGAPSDLIIGPGTEAAAGALCVCG